MLVCVLTAMHDSWKFKKEKQNRAQMVNLISQNIEAGLKLLKSKKKESLLKNK